MPSFLDRLKPAEPVGRDVWFLLFVVGTAFMASRYDFQFTTLALPKFQASLALTDKQVADITAIAKLGAIPAVIATFMADRIGRKPLFLWSIFGFCAAAIMAALAQGPIALTTALFLTRFFTMVDELLAVVLLVEAAPPLARGWMIGALSACGALGDGLALTLYGLFADSSPDAWRWLYAAGALPALLTVWWRMKMPESRTFEATRSEGDLTASQIRALREVWRPAALVFVAAFLFWVPLSPALSFIPQHLQAGQGWSSGQVSGLILVAGTVGLIGTFAGGAMADRFGRRTVAVGGTVLAGIGLAGVYGGLSGGVIMASYTLGLAGWFGASVALKALMAETVPASVRGTMAGLTEIANTMGAVTGITLVGQLAGAGQSIGAGTLTVLPVIGLAAVAMLLLRETRGRSA